MIDLYALPSAWPGFNDKATDPRERVSHLEGAMSGAISDTRFIPHLTMHEFEALLFAAPEACAEQAGDPDLATHMKAAVSARGEPELINDGADTAPSKRILQAWPGYAKTIDGPTIAGDIGLVRIRSACPHFDSWLSRLEGL